MQPSLIHHSDPKELRQIQDSFAGKVNLIFLYHSIKLKLENLYPYSTFDLYSYSTTDVSYWFVTKTFLHVKITDVFVAYEGKFDVGHYSLAIAELAEKADIFRSPVMFLAEELLIGEVEKFAQTHANGFLTLKHPSNIFYMTEAQMSSIKGIELVSQLPDGYKLGTSDPIDDAEFITSCWQHAKKGDVEETRTKLANLPSSCIRYEGKSVAFEMLSQSGQLNHLFVLEEHRGKGLGKIVELDLCQKSARIGITVHKCVEVLKTSLINSTTRLPFWTKGKHADGSDLIFVFYKLMWK